MGNPSTELLHSSNHLVDHIELLVIVAWPKYQVPPLVATSPAVPLLMLAERSPTN